MNQDKKETSGICGFRALFLEAERRVLHPADVSLAQLFFECRAVDVDDLLIVFQHSGFEVEHLIPIGANAVLPLRQLIRTDTESS